MPKRSDTELIAALRRLLRDGSIVLQLDTARLDKVDSPVSVQAESTRWLYVLVAVVALAGLWQGVAGIAVAAMVAVAVWYGWVRRDVARRIRARVETRALDDATLWRKLWRHGGVRLEPRDGPPCVAPRDNWMQFVRDRSPMGES